MKSPPILNEKRKISTPRAPKIRAAKTSWKTGTKIISSPKRVSFQEVSVAHLELRDAMKILSVRDLLVLRCSGIGGPIPGRPGVLRKNSTSRTLSHKKDSIEALLWRYVDLWTLTPGSTGKV